MKLVTSLKLAILLVLLLGLGYAVGAPDWRNGDSSSRSSIFVAWLNGGVVVDEQEESFVLASVSRDGSGVIVLTARGLDFVGGSEIEQFIIAGNPEGELRLRATNGTQLNDEEVDFLIYDILWSPGMLFHSDGILSASLSDNRKHWDLLRRNGQEVRVEIAAIERFERRSLARER